MVDWYKTIAKLTYNLIIMDKYSARLNTNITEFDNDESKSYIYIYNPTATKGHK